MTPVKEVAQQAVTENLGTALSTSVPSLPLQQEIPSEMSSYSEGSQLNQLQPNFAVGSSPQSQLRPYTSDTCINTGFPNSGATDGQTGAETDVSANVHSANQSSYGTPSKLTPENTITVNEDPHRRMSHQGSLEKGSER